MRFCVLLQNCSVNFSRLCVSLSFFQWWDVEKGEALQTFYPSGTALKKIHVSADFSTFVTIDSIGILYILQRVVWPLCSQKPPKKSTLLSNHTLRFSYKSCISTGYIQMYSRFAALKLNKIHRSMLFVDETAKSSSKTGEKKWQLVYRGATFVTRFWTVNTGWAGSHQQGHRATTLTSNQMWAALMRLLSHVIWEVFSFRSM